MPVAEQFLVYHVRAQLDGGVAQLHNPALHRDIKNGGISYTLFYGSHTNRINTVPSGREGWESKQIPSSGIASLVSSA